MRLRLTMPRFGDQMQQARIETAYVTPGDELKPGSKLFDVRVDLGGAGTQDCPPLAFFRLVCLERAWVRTVAVRPGESLTDGAPLAEFTTTADEPLDTTATRPLRTSRASILATPTWPIPDQPPAS